MILRNPAVAHSVEAEDTLQDAERMLELATIEWTTLETSHLKHFHNYCNLPGICNVRLFLTEKPRVDLIALHLL